MTSGNMEYLRDDISSLLDRLVDAHEKMVVAHVNASTCRTSFDYNKANRAEESYEQTRDEVLAEIVRLVTTIS